MDAVSAAEHLHLFIEYANRIKLASISYGINTGQSLMRTDTNLVMGPWSCSRSISSVGTQ